MGKQWLVRIGTAAAIAGMVVGVRVVSGRISADWWWTAGSSALVFVIALVVETIHDRRVQRDS
jgi:hypothetical protein